MYCKKEVTLRMTADDQLTQHARDLLNILRLRGDWVSRGELARATNRNRLTPYDVGLLQRMIDLELIEVRQRKIISPIGIAYDYKVK